MHMDAKQLWQTVLSDMEGRVSRTAFDNWLRPTTIVAFYDDIATIAAANRSGASTLQSRYGNDIEQILSEIAGRPIHAEFTVRKSEEHDEIAPQNRTTPLSASSRSRKEKRSHGHEPLNGVIPTSRQLELTAMPTNGLNPRYVYEHYVVGSSNRFAHAASLSVAEHPGGKYNPFFIYGGVGLGKTGPKPAT